MQSSKYARTLVLLTGSIACVGLNYCLVTTGHYRLPLFVLIAFVLVVAGLFRKLPAPITGTDEMRRNLLKVSSGLRRLGLFGAVGIAVYILTSSRRDFQGMPTWGIILMYVWGSVVVCAYLWGSRWYKRKADQLPDGTKKDPAK